MSHCEDAHPGTEPCKAPVHVCRLSDPWPTGHPIPPEDPARLQGPELGFAVYTPIVPADPGILGAAYYAPRVVKVIERSYVWSPGECRSKGGYRHYDWSVIEEGPDKYRTVVVNDTDLHPLPERNGRVATVHLTYAVDYNWSALLRGEDPS
jgi:hypothetical protein